MDSHIHQELFVDGHALHVYKSLGCGIIFHLGAAPSSDCLFVLLCYLINR